MIIGAALDDKVLAKEYIEGERFSDIVQEHPDREVGARRARWRGSGRRWARSTRRASALGDSKATNVIVMGDGGLYFTDLEQAIEGGDQAWDIAVSVRLLSGKALVQGGGD